MDLIQQRTYSKYKQSHKLSKQEQIQINKESLKLYREKCSNDRIIYLELKNSEVLKSKYKKGKWVEKVVTFENKEKNQNLYMYLSNCEQKLVYMSEKKDVLNDLLKRKNPNYLAAFRDEAKFNLSILETVEKF